MRSSQKRQIKLSGTFLSAVLTLWLLVAAILIGLTEDVVTSEPIVNLDKYWSEIFFTWRSDLGVRIFSILTQLGNWQFVLPALFIICYLLFRNKKKLYIVPFLFTVASAESVTFIGKILIHRSRPLVAAILETDFSFPSGHATIAVVFYGYLAYILIRFFKDRLRRLAIVVGAVLVILIIGFSRLYLDVHYLSDVLGGYMVGILALIAGISLTEYLKFKSNQKLKSKPLK